MKLATRLSLSVTLVAATAIPILGIGIFYLTRNIIEASITVEQVQASRYVLDIIDRTMHRAYQDIELISQDPYLQSILDSVEQPGEVGRDSGERQPGVGGFNTKMRLTGPWDVLNVFDRQGKIVYSSLAKLSGNDISDVPIDSSAYYAAVTGQHYYSDLLVSAMVNRPTVLFSAPIQDPKTGNIRGAVVGHFSWPVILQILDRTHSSNTIRLFNRNGVVIATPSKQKGDIFKVRLGTLDPVRQLLTGKQLASGIITQTENFGSFLATAVLQTGHLSYRGSNWGLLLGIPEKSAMAPATRQAGTVTTVIVVVMVILIGLIYLLARRISRPIETLKKAAVAIGDGDYDYSINIRSGDEIEELSEHFIQMASNRKQAEQELHVAQAELIKQERMVILGQLTATVSHELRNPLGTIAISLVTLQQQLPAFKELPALQRMVRAAERCDRIIDELLDYTRLEARTLESIPLDSFLRSFMGEHVIPEEIEVSCDFSASEMRVDIDTDLLRRALVNVIDNACQAMAETSGEKRLSISTKIEGNRCRVTLSDNGPGIPASLMEHIFEPMFSTKIYGVGLGMPIVQHIVEELHGELELESVEGEGTAVSLWLPLAEETVAIP